MRWVSATVPAEFDAPIRPDGSDPMSQNSVIKLKELLFDKESHEISALTARLAEVAERAGSDVHFRRSVAASLEGALREAEASQHRQVADALAPLVIRTVRTEVEANSDTLPAKLYPHIGVMVRDYVRSAIRDLMEDLNQRLEDGLTKNRLALRLKSWTTGRSMAELALAGGRRFHVEELHLIRRGSGELLAHWTRPDTSATPQPDGRDALFSGMLTAMTAFIEEVYEADKAGLRAIDFGGHTIYLRGSPHYLLAAKCHGEAGPGLETLLDEEFLRALQTEQAAGAGSANGAGAPTPHDLATLAARLEAGIAERQKLRGDQGRSRMRPLRVLLWLIALALAALLGWYGYTAYKRHTVQSAVDRVIAETPALKGYPTRAVVSGTGERIEISGLAPSGDIRTDVLGRIREVAPNASVTEAIGVVPGAESASLAQQISQLREQLTAVQANLEKLTATASGMAQAAAVETQLRAIRNDIEALKPKPDPRADLELWMRNHAIFFSEETNFHDERETGSALDALAALMRRTDMTIRIIGFTDERGTSDRNLPLAYARAEKVAAELTRRGINAARLIKVARASVLDISAGSGPSSPNRRVTFETVFVGEAR